MQGDEQWRIHKVRDTYDDEIWELYCTIDETRCAEDRPCMCCLVARQEREAADDGG